MSLWDSESDRPHPPGEPGNCRNLPLDSLTIGRLAVRANERY